MQLSKDREIKSDDCGQFNRGDIAKRTFRKLRIAKGDSLYVTETPRGVELSPYDEEFAAQMEIAEAVMREDRDVLRKLAE